MKTRIAIFICILFLTLSPSALSADTFQIAFLSQRDGVWGIYVINMDGSGEYRLSNNAAWGAPVWSPDGEQLAFIRLEAPGSQIYLVNANGSDERRLSGESVWNFAPAWSPDGSQIAFVELNSTGISDVRLYNFETRSESVLGEYARWSTPSWSPDGNQLALQLVTRWTGAGGPYSDIYTIDADRQNLQKLTENEIYAREPKWSPDGIQIAYISTSDAVVVMNVDGLNKRELFGDQPEWPEELNWSPDSQSIVFTRITPISGTRRVESNLYTVNVITGQLRALTQNQSRNRMPIWSPDGNYIAFVSDSDKQTDQIYLVEPDGTNLTQLTNSAGGNYFPAWRPDSF